MIHACTIVAPNYLAQAQVLVDSFRRHHPDGTFVVLVLDDPGRVRPTVRGAEVALVDEIGVPPHDLDRMTVTYEIIELATAVKPWLLRYLLASGRDHVAYFDPDISIERRIEELPALAREHSIVLTPHLTEPMPRDLGHPTEQTILLSGTYNLGFIAVGDTDDGRRMLDWWGTRLVTDARVDVANGYFTDQRLVDLVPGLFRHLVVTDPSWNVAYWNLATRPLARAADGTVLVAGRPLTFLHLSGYSPDRPHLLSKHQGLRPRLLLSEMPVLRELCDDYARRLKEEGYDDHQATERPFGVHDGVPLTELVLRLIRDDFDRRDRDEHTTLGIGRPSGLPLFDWLTAGGPDSVGGLGRLLTTVYRMRPDLQTAYPEVRRGDTDSFLDWAELFGQDEHDIPLSVIVSARARAKRPARVPTALGRRVDSLRSTAVNGVELCGYLTADLGLGETARQFATSLESAGVPLSTTTYRRTGSVLGTPWTDRRPAAGTRHDTLLMCLNADMTPHFQQEVGRRYLRGRYRIGLWFWELADLPDEMTPALDLVDEVWVTSEYCASAIRARTSKPVTVVPHPVHVPGRTGLRIPEVPAGGPFTFLFVFDHFSVLERKNPLGAIEAFERAFPLPGEARLVIKSISGRACLPDREQVRYAAARRPDVVVVERNLERAELDALMWASDCYLSLHRSEGFGQTIGEMMSIGRPVVATGYSGSTELATPDNSFLVDYRLGPVPEGCDPYPAGAAWAEPDLDHAAELMRRVFEDADLRAVRGARAAADMARGFSPAALGEVARARLEEIWTSPRHARRTGRQQRRRLVTVTR